MRAAWFSLRAPSCPARPSPPCFCGLATEPEPGTTQCLPARGLGTRHEQDNVGVPLRNPWPHLAIRVEECSGSMFSLLPGAAPLRCASVTTPLNGRLG